jgi:dsDNA-binding SOS-regulon protein
MTNLPVVMTVEQLAAFLGQDKHELYKAIKAGKVPGVRRAGKRWYVGRDAYLKAITGTVKGSKPKAPDLPWA